MTEQHHTVTIETEKTGVIALTPQEFEMLLMAAMVGLDGHPFEGQEAKVADGLFQKVIKASDLHSA